MNEQHGDVNEQHGDARGDIHDAAGCYAVDALSAPELAEFELHLSHCESCSREVADLSEALAELSVLSATKPPPELRQSVLASIAQVTPLPPERSRTGAEDSPAAQPRHAADSGDHGATAGEKVATAGPVRARQSRPVRRGVQRAVTFALAAAVVVALAMGGWVVRLNQQHQAQQAQATAVAELMSAPDVKVYPVTLPSGARGSYTVSQRQNRGLFTATSVPPAGQDKTYQLWAVHNGKPVSSGLFSGGDTVRTWLSHVQGAEALAITVEPGNGMPQPTMDPFAGAKL